MGEERMQRGPSDTCHSRFGLWTSVPARSQCSTTLLQGLVDSAEWEITHQELTFRIWWEGGIREAVLRWDGLSEEGKR